MLDEKVVLFRVGNELYGLGISVVERILHETPVTPIPRTPKVLLGIFDLRGETLPVLDLRRRFEMEERRDAGSFVVTQTPQGKVALRVDRVEGIIPFDPQSVEAQPEQWSNPTDQFIRGIGKHDGGLFAMLDPDQITPQDVQKRLSKLDKAAA